MYGLRIDPNWFSPNGMDEAMVVIQQNQLATSYWPSRYRGLYTGARLGWSLTIDDKIRLGLKAGYYGGGKSKNDSDISLYDPYTSPSSGYESKWMENFSYQTNTSMQNYGVNFNYFDV